MLFKNLLKIQRNLLKSYYIGESILFSTIWNRTISGIVLSGDPLYFNSIVSKYVLQIMHRNLINWSKNKLLLDDHIAVDGYITYPHCNNSYHN